MIAQSPRLDIKGSEQWQSVNLVLCYHSDKVTFFWQNFDDGYTYFADGKLICLVSVPHLFGEYDNKAAILTIQPDLTHSIQVVSYD